MIRLFRKLPQFGDKSRPASSRWYSQRLSESFSYSAISSRTVTWGAFGLGGLSCLSYYSYCFTTVESRKLNCQGDSAASSSSSSHSEASGIVRPSTEQSLFAERSTWSILKSLAVFQLCQFQWIVDVAPHIIRAAETIHLSAPVYWLVKHTFFAQFCGGEQSKDVIPVIQSLQRRGIGSILDLSIESDAGGGGKIATNEEQEQRINHVLDLIKDCITTASAQPGSIVAIKVTALGSTQSLKSVSGVLLYCRDLFRHYQIAYRPEEGQHAEISKSKLDFAGFCKMMNWLPGDPPSSDLKQLFAAADEDGDGFISWNQFNSIVGIDKCPSLYLGQVPADNPLVLQESPVSPTNTKILYSVSEKYLPVTSAEDLQELKRIDSRLSELCRYAIEKQVKLMVDAEQSYFQTAINHLSLQMMKRYNISSPSHAGATSKANIEDAHIFNTYQMYLSDGVDRLKSDYQLAVAMKEQFVFAAKLVRGAYMQSERRRASELEIMDPINPNIEITHAAYDSAVLYLLKECTSENPVAVCIASHNRPSIKKALEYIKNNTERLSVAASISFAQLYGMHDYTTHSLASSGYKVYKYLPYGPVSDVIPYLLRRAAENRAIFAEPPDSEARKLSDKSLLWLELKRRFGFVSAET